MTQNKNARLAGLAYLAVVIFGIISLVVIPGKFFVWNDPAATVARIQADPLVFRLGILSSLFCYLAFTALVLLLFRLLKPVNIQGAVAMAVLAGCSVPVSVFSVHDQLNVLDLLSASSPFTSNAPTNLRVMQHLYAYKNGIFVAELFWSTWLFPLGWLIYRSGFLPRFLGALLMVGSSGYFLHTFLLIGYPDADATLLRALRLPASAAEIGTCLWLLIMGTRKIPGPGQTRAKEMK